MRTDNALIYRVILPWGPDYVVIEEKWDTSHPDCPFVQAFPETNSMPNPYIRQTTMRKMECDQMKIEEKFEDEQIGGDK